MLCSQYLAERSPRTRSMEELAGRLRGAPVPYCRKSSIWRSTRRSGICRCRPGSRPTDSPGRRPSRHTSYGTPWGCGPCGGDVCGGAGWGQLLYNTMLLLQKKYPSYFYISCFYSCASIFSFIRIRLLTELSI